MPDDVTEAARLRPRGAERRVHRRPPAPLRSRRPIACGRHASDHDRTRTWWARPGLGVADGRLTIAGSRRRTARARARHAAVRLRPRAGARAGRGAARRVRRRRVCAAVVRYALKAQREPGFLRFLRERVPFVGIDVCSPGELEWALEHGWAPEEISYTGTNLSDRDLARIVPTGCHLNVDLLSPARAGRAHGARPRRGHQGEPSRGRDPRGRRRERLRGREADEVRRLPGAAGTRRSRSPAATTSRSTRCTCTPATSTSTTRSTWSTR